jgi:hypothetical protein
MYKKMDKTIHGNCVAFKLNFQQLGLNLQENKAHHSKEHGIMV